MARRKTRLWNSTARPGGRPNPRRWDVAYYQAASTKPGPVVPWTPGQPLPRQPEKWLLGVWGTRGQVLAIAAILPRLFPGKVTTEGLKITLEDTNPNTGRQVWAIRHLPARVRDTDHLLRQARCPGLKTLSLRD